MAQVTIRQVPEEWATKAKAVAVEKGVSMNSALVDALKRGLEVEGKTKRNNLDQFAGDSPEGFGPEFEEAMDDCSRIDEGSWK